MRTRYSFYNILVNLISGVLLPVLGFVKVRLFISLYGDELNGLYLVFSQVIQYLNICELSFSLAFRQMLFKPLAEDDKEEVNRLYSGVSSIYHIVGIAVLLMGVVLSFIIPLFNDMDMSLMEMSGLFLLMALPFGISYFLLPPTLLIIADQKEYKISVWIQSIAFIRMVLMIVAILLKMSYVWIFVIEGLNVLLSNIIANRISLKTYPWLKRDKSIRTNEAFISSARGTMVQRLSNIAINNSDSIILNIASKNLSAVSIYGAYTYLIEAATKIINSVITSPINSFGNLFSSDAEDAYSVFEEFYEFASYLATILAVCIFAVLDEFVLIWVNQSSYILPISAAIIFSINVFYLTQREAVILIRDANGLFVEAKKNAYLLTLVKIVCSFVFVYMFGIVGVLAGTFVAYFLVDFTYNPRLVYEKVFHLNSSLYYKKFALRFVITALLAVGTYMLYQNFIGYVGQSLLHFLITIIAVGVGVSVIVTVVYYLLFPSFRRLIQRGIRLLKRNH